MAGEIIRASRLLLHLPFYGCTRSFQHHLDPRKHFFSQSVSFKCGTCRLAQCAVGEGSHGLFSSAGKEMHTRRCLLSALAPPQPPRGMALLPPVANHGTKRIHTSNDKTPYHREYRIPSVKLQEDWQPGLLATSLSSENAHSVTRLAVRSAYR